MDETLRFALAYIDEHEEDLIGLWENIVRIESQSSDLEGVARLADHLDTYCDALGMGTKLYRFDGAGPALAAWTRPGTLPPVALMAHLDTVHPKGAFGADTFRVEGDTVHGPGAYDCKGGIAVAFLAIRALLHAGYHRRQMKLLLIGDEETAHALSHEESLILYKDHIPGCAAAFNCESGPLNGDVITRRKGGFVVSLLFQGRASHAGNAPEKGASAIREAAHKVLDIEALTNLSGTTFNCGTIQGGSGPNVVPDRCEMKVGVRFKTKEARDTALAQLQEIRDRVYVPGVSTALKMAAGFQAMELTEKTDPLFQIWRRASEELGHGSPNTAFTGGCSDAAYVAMEGVPVLCGVGVRGANHHALTEYAVLSSLRERARILVKTILDLPDDF